MVRSATPKSIAKAAPRPSDPVTSQARTRPNVPGLKCLFWRLGAGTSLGGEALFQQGAVAGGDGALGAAVVERGAAVVERGAAVVCHVREDDAAHGGSLARP